MKIEQRADGWHSIADDGTDSLTIPAADLNFDAITPAQVEGAQTRDDAQSFLANLAAHRMDWLNMTPEQLAANNAINQAMIDAQTAHDQAPADHVAHHVTDMLHH